MMAKKPKTQKKKGVLSTSAIGAQQEAARSALFRARKLIAKLEELDVAEVLIEEALHAIKQLRNHDKVAIQLGLFDEIEIAGEPPAEDPGALSDSKSSRKRTPRKGHGQKKRTASTGATEKRGEMLGVLTGGDVHAEVVSG